MGTLEAFGTGRGGAPKQTQKHAKASPEMPRNAPRGTEKPREAQKGPQGPRKAGRNTERFTEGQKDPKMRREAPRRAEKPSGDHSFKWILSSGHFGRRNRTIAGRRGLSSGHLGRRHHSIAGRKAFIKWSLGTP